MSDFKTKFITIPEHIDWNKFNIKDMNNSSVVIYVRELKKDIEGDMNKLNILKQMPNLSSIKLVSPDFNVGIYMGELLKEFTFRKSFDLLDDYKNQDRSYIQPSSLHKGLPLSTIPNSYIQWGANIEGLNSGNNRVNNIIIEGLNSGNNRVNNIIKAGTRDTADLNDSYPSEEAFTEINRIIDEFCKIPNLTLIDKVVLVANYLQANVQFVEGRVSHAIDGNYECQDYSLEKYDGVDKVDNVLFDKIGKCNCISRTMMYMLNNPKMNVNCRIACDTVGGHAYCYIYDDETGQLYCTDPTWCISRNPNRFTDTLKASKFSDEYLLIGQDKLSTMNYHNTTNILPQEFAQNSIDRKLIQESVEKLKTYGISFDYPMEIPLPSVRTDRQLGETITP